eukprot:TRINITY_DN16697_c0_g1_i1.p1 TRINITY_DN16697_c0_g1~~TRINITY_DN16697_c0_g1_i1.p1  ORF type:complete len:164 (+),score=37.59 TRINITY_DN16697_c0_g1_i1:92-583(+)
MYMYLLKKKALKNYQPVCFQEDYLLNIEKLEFVCFFFPGNIRHKGRYSVQDLLTQVYLDLVETNLLFEIVSVPFNQRDKEAWEKHVTDVPWSSLSFNNPQVEEIINTYGVREYQLPKLIIINGVNKMIINSDAIPLVQKQGARAFPNMEADNIKGKKKKLWIS